MIICLPAARREGHQRRNRGQQQQQKHHQYAREQTPSTILASPNTVSDRLSIKPDEAAWTAGGQALTKEQVALANSFNPLGKYCAVVRWLPLPLCILSCTDLADGICRELHAAEGL